MPSPADNEEIASLDEFMRGEGECFRPLGADRGTCVAIGQQRVARR
jgi:hypothetical protein